MDKAKRTRVCENENANCGKKIRRACAQITLDLRRLWRSYDSSCSNAAPRDSQRAEKNLENHCNSE